MVLSSVRSRVLSFSVVVLLLGFPGLVAGKAWQEQIFPAIERNDLAKVKEMVKAVPDVVHYRDKDGWTPLAYAARFNRVDIAKFLIDKGADVNSADSHKFRPLHHAAANGSRAVAEVLVAKGADVNARTEGAETARKLAKNNGHTKVADFLAWKGGF